jgi:deoxyribodipyrimidine photolyase-like uncharacterized protein
MEDSFLPASVGGLALGFVFQSLGKSFQSLSVRDDAIYRACDQGVNIDLLHNTDVARELSSARSTGDFPLVCVKGVVKTYEHNVNNIR